MIKYVPVSAKNKDSYADKHIKESDKATTKGTDKVDDTLFFDTLEDCQAWCNANEYMWFTPKKINID